MPSHKPFQPWLYALGSRIRQTSLSDMASDAALMAAAAVDTCKLLDTPSLCVNFDLTLWAEAAGCGTDWSAGSPRVQPGGSADPNPDQLRECERVSTLTAAIKRAKGALPQRPIACAIPGPAVLAQHLAIEPPFSRMDQFTVGELLTEFATVLCEHKVDRILVVEPNSLDDAALEPWVEAKHYAKIAKLAAHYTIQTTLLCPNASLNERQTTQFDAADAVVARADQIASAVFAHAEKGVPVAGFGTGNTKLPEQLQELEPGSYFLTTDADLAPECDIAAVQQDLATIRAYLSDG